MPTVLRTSMRVILPVLEARLVAITGLPAERVTPWVGDDLPTHFAGDHDLVLRLRGIVPDAAWQEGTGRFGAQLRERVEVVVRTRLSLDAAGGSRAWLVNQTYGHVVLRDRVLDALVGFYPVDDDGNGLTTCAVLLAAAQPPRPDGRTPRSPAAWGSEALPFDVCYEPALTQSDIG